MEDVPYEGVVHRIQGNIISVTSVTTILHTKQILNYPFLFRAMLTILSTKINMFRVKVLMNLLSFPQ